MESRQLVMSGSLLTEEQLAVLRRSYDAEALLSLGRRFLAAPYPAAGPWAEYVMGSLYPSPAISGRERELILTALLAARQQPGTMAVHMYWAMVEGVSPETLAHVVLLTGTYTGIDSYTVGIRTLHRLSALLRERIDADEADTTAIMRSIIQLFPA